MKPIIKLLERKINKSLEEFLKEEYSINKKSARYIASELDVSQAYILRHLKKFNIKIRVQREAQYSNVIKPNKKELIKLYSNDQKTTYEIANVLSVSPATIQRWLRDYNIPLRNTNEFRWGDKPKISKKELEKMYVKNKLSSLDIAKKLGVSFSTICNRLKRYKIPLRTSTESKWGHIKKLSKTDLENLYIKQNKSTLEIGKEVGVSSNTIGEWLKEYNVQIRNKRGIYNNREKRKELVDKILRISGKTPEILISNTILVNLFLQF